MSGYRRVRVLLVDDDPAFRDMLALSLRQGLFEVVAAGSGEEALERLAREKFDWLVSDVRMEGIGGVELCERAARLYPGLRTVLVSADFHADGLRPGSAKRLFVKPFEVADLAACLRA
jgi:two-component system, NtrC family, response regulator AtoC